MEKNHDQDEISRLKREISLLKKELRRERQKNSHFNTNIRKRTAKSDNISSLWNDKINSVSVYHGHSYVKTVIAFIKASAFYRVWTSGLALFRRFRLLSYIAAFISYSLALIGTGALLFVYLSAAAVVLISSALLLLTFIILAFNDIKKSNRFLTDTLINKNLYIFFLNDQRSLGKCGFFAQNALDLSNMENSAVLIVTPTLFSQKGLFQKNTRTFLTLRKERENIFIIRKYYYFSFKKRVIPKLLGNVTMIF